MTEHPVTPGAKALRVNLDPRIYGTFAEIGAGQEVVRWFFQAGGAAGTIAKSISAYDMKVSDATCGKCDRYVCKERLESMIVYEQGLNFDRLDEARSHNSTFFTFADTVSARNYKGSNECHGWLGISFQTEPDGPISQVIVHVRMLDKINAQQQEALGIVGVNLIYGACFLFNEPEHLLDSLLDDLNTDRIEIDLVEFEGPAFKAVDNRVMSLRLVQLGLTGAAMFSAKGEVLQPSEILYKRPVVMERGRFRPVTYVNLDLARSAVKKFESISADVEEGETLCIMEMTMSNLLSDGEVDLDDFVSRADVLATTGHTIMISDFPEYSRLAAYLTRYTNRGIGLAMGVPNLIEIFKEKHYQHLNGGILESFGRLFKNNLKLFIYPYADQTNGDLITVDKVKLEGALNQLYSYLVARGFIVQLDDFNQEYLDIFSHEVLKKIEPGNRDWEAMVPPEVAQAIKTRGLFGYDSMGSTGSNSN